LPEVDRAKDKAANDFSTNRQYLNDAEKIKKEAPEKLESIKSGEKTITQVKQELKKSDKPKSPKSNRGKNKFRYCVEYTLAKRYAQCERRTYDHHEYATKEEALDAGMNKIKKYYMKKKYDGHIWLEICAKKNLSNGGYTTQKLYGRKYECKNKELAILDEKKPKHYISKVKSDIKEMQKKIKAYEEKIKWLSLEHELPAPTESKIDDYDITKLKRPRPWKGEFIYKYPDDSETKIEASVTIVDMRELHKIAKDRAPKDFDHEKGLISTLRN
jgi:hypothetical protein